MHDTHDKIECCGIAYIGMSLQLLTFFSASSIYTYLYKILKVLQKLLSIMQN